jgi:pimeloyl-ACP methyl ester carboxylesterase
VVEITGGAIPSADPARLPRNSLYRSLSGRAEAHAHYDGVLARLPFAVESRYVHTRYGRTHLSIGGNPDGAPLIVLPAMSIAGPQMLEFFKACAKTRLLIAVDLIGQPGRSEDRGHSARDHGFGRWLAEVLDALRIERADMATASFGSSVALDLAAFAPERVGKLALVMPAGLTPRLPLVRLYFRFLMPWLMHRFFPDGRRVPAIARKLGKGMNEDQLRYFDIVVRQTAFWRHRPAGPFFARDLEGYREPVFLVTAGQDNVLPCVPTRANAHQALRIAEEIHLADSTHLPTDDDMADVHGKIAAYLA